MTFFLMLLSDNSISGIYGMINKMIPTLKRHGFPGDKVNIIIAGKIIR